MTNWKELVQDEPSSQTYNPWQQEQDEDRVVEGQATFRDIPRQPASPSPEHLTPEQLRWRRIYKAAGFFAIGGLLVGAGERFLEYMFDMFSGDR